MTLLCLFMKQLHIQQCHTFLFLFSAADSLKSVEDDTTPKDAVDGGTNEAKDGVGGKNLKDGENGAVETTANAETPTKSSKLSIFGSKDKKDKADKNASDKDKSTNMPLGLGGKPKGASSDGFDGKSK